MRLKHPTLTICLIISVLSLVLYACNRENGPFHDPCLNITCKNGTFVNNNLKCTCRCTSGYKGPNCDTLSATAFIGQYTCSNQSCSSSGSALLTITVGANASNLNLVNISNLHQAGGTTIATVDSVGTSLSIASQSLSGSTISGRGTLSGTTLTITYITTNGGIADTCRGVFIKQ